MINPTTQITPFPCTNVKTDLALLDDAEEIATRAELDDEEKRLSFGSGTPLTTPTHMETGYHTTPQKISPADPHHHIKQGRKESWTSTDDIWQALSGTGSTFSDHSEHWPSAQTQRTHLQRRWGCQTAS